MTNDPTTPTRAPILVKQREMARLLQVGERWLRDSGCPVILLPGGRPSSRPMLRYDVEQAQAWYRQFSSERRAA